MTWRRRLPPRRRRVPPRATSRPVPSICSLNLPLRGATVVSASSSLVLVVSSSEKDASGVEADVLPDDGEGAVYEPESRVAVTDARQPHISA